MSGIGFNILENARQLQMGFPNLQEDFEAVTFLNVNCYRKIYYSLLLEVSKVPATSIPNTELILNLQINIHS